MDSPAPPASKRRMKILGLVVRAAGSETRTLDGVATTRVGSRHRSSAQRALKTRAQAVPLGDTSEFHSQFLLRALADSEYTAMRDIKARCDLLQVQLAFGRWGISSREITSCLDHGPRGGSPWEAHRPPECEEGESCSGNS